MPRSYVYNVQFADILKSSQYSFCEETIETKKKPNFNKIYDGVLHISELRGPIKKKLSKCNTVDLQKSETRQIKLFGTYKPTENGKEIKT